MAAALDSMAVSAWYVSAAMVSKVSARLARPVTLVTLAKSACTVGASVGLTTVTLALPFACEHRVPRLSVLRVLAEGRGREGRHRGRHRAEFAGSGGG